MTNLRHLHCNLGIEVTKNPKYIFISQSKYIGELLNNFGMGECNRLSTPMEQILKFISKEGNEFEDATKYTQLVGSLIYHTITKLDILFVVGIISKIIQKTCEGHWSAAKRVPKYLKGTQDFGIKYFKVDDFNLIGYSDLDFDRDKQNGVSTSCYVNDS
jgi:hypothetical protein